MAVLLRKLTVRPGTWTRRALFDRMGGPLLRDLAEEPRLFIARPALARRSGLPPGDVAGLLEPYRRRIRAQRITVVSVRGACYAVGAALLCAIAHMIIGFVPLLLSVGVLVAVLVATVVVCCFQQLDLVEVARLLDRRLKLHEALGTAMELETGLDPSGITHGPIAHRQRHEAQRLLGDLSPAWVLPGLRQSGPVRLLLILSCGWLLILISAANVSTSPSAVGGSQTSSQHMTLSQAAPHQAIPHANPFAHYASAMRSAAQPAAVPTPSLSAHSPGSYRNGAARGQTRKAPAGNGASSSKSTQSPAANGQSGSAGASQGTGQSSATRSGSSTPSNSGAQSGTAGSVHSSTSQGNGSPAVGQGQPSVSNTAGNSASSSSSSNSAGDTNSGQPGNQSGGPQGKGSQSGAQSNSGSQGSGSDASAGQSPSNGSAKKSGKPGSSTTSGSSGSSTPKAGAQSNKSTSPQGDQQGASAHRQPPPAGGRAGSSISPGQAVAMPQDDQSLGVQSASGQGDTVTNLSSASSPGGGTSSTQLNRVQNMVPPGNTSNGINGTALVISGHGAHGQIADVGRTNSVRTAGSVGGSVSADAPATGPTAPRAYVAPGTDYVAGDQQALIKAYFSPNQATGQ